MINNVQRVSGNDKSVLCSLGSQIQHADVSIKNIKITNTVPVDSLGLYAEYPTLIVGTLADLALRELCTENKQFMPKFTHPSGFFHAQNTQNRILPIKETCNICEIQDC